ncbi:hypothetical protein SAMN04487920_1519 [Bacillus mycoides]|uniref:hypothetical protein n=1 Tax=Bacillus mycoides TaxID=1405 RepID=UPI0008F22DEF|nr:hypothetical protein [Bacillus mycoides]SFQ92652.1 hypothetical protein SAMN04487920_1519 [Bacillus mycoides]
MKKDIKKDLPKRHQEVLSVLPLGRFNSITTTEIMARTGIKDKRRVSAIISELVEVYKQPIATTSRKEFKGVFIVQDIIDYQIGKEALMSRKNHIEKRDSSYTEGCLQIFKGLVTLDEPKRKQSNSDAESMGSSIK